jgi:hypothetical protein
MLTRENLNDALAKFGRFVDIQVLRLHLELRIGTVACTINVSQL